MPRQLAALTTLALSLCSLIASAQGTSYYEDTRYDPYQRRMYTVGRVRPHTTVRSYRLDELREFFDTDSVLYVGIRKLPHTRAKVINDFLNTDFLSWPWRGEKKPVYIALNPLFDFELGMDKSEHGSSRTFTNNRGFYLNGNLGRNFWFYTDFCEIQADFADYMNNLCDSLRSVPGTGNFRKGFKKYNQPYDYQTASGYVCWNIGPYVDFLVGKTKTFIGDGYRSLLLGDGANATPQFRINLTMLRVKYSFIAQQLRADNLTGLSNNGTSPKYSFTHFIDCNIGRRFTLGFFENVTQCSWRVDGSHRGVDWEYLNPFIIFRPGEFHAGSPDKMIVGATGKFIIMPWMSIYAQFLLNEFQIKDFFSGNGYWSNKWALQVGLRGQDIFHAPGLDYLFEFNYIRPYCYSQYDAMANYTHHQQSMAHPLGANLIEGLGILSYHHGRIQARAQFNYSQYGDDFATDTTSYGHNPNLRSRRRPKSYGVDVLQGLRTKVLYFDAQASWIINPRSMLNIAAGVRIRKRTSDLCDEVSRNAYIALRWSIKSHYYDY